MRKSHPTILIVENNPDDQDLIRMGFKKIGVTNRICMVDDGLEAIAYMMGEGRYSDRTKFPYPTFIITDLKMPGADGFAVLEFLKANPEWAVIPTVVFSSSSDLDDIKKAYMLGASSYHIKPATNTALVHQLLVLHAYWMTCEVPEVDSTGRQLHTGSKGKLGERFPQAGDLTPHAKLRRKIAGVSSTKS
jgi:CheY-like chemotaxis protein